jgi:predicted ester cyclase
MFRTVLKTVVQRSGRWLLLALLLSACQPVQWLSETKTAVAASAETSLEQANQAVIQRFYEEVINQKQLDRFPEFFDANAIIHDLSPAMDASILFTGLPDLHVTVDRWVLKGDIVTSIVTFTGTHEGEMMGVAPTHKPVTWTHIDIHRVKNGKIVEVWHNIPYGDILRQIQDDPTAMTDTGETEMEAANQAVVQRFYEEVVNQKKLEVFQEVFDPHMVEYSLGIGPTLTDTEMFAGFPDLHLTVDLWVVEGDLVTAVVTVSGTHQAEFIGVAPTGNTVSWSSIDIWRVKNGKITDLNLAQNRLQIIDS